MVRDHWRGAERVFAWSFYSQGTRDRVASGDSFIAEALKWFGDPDPVAGSPWDRGERLARLIRRQRTLLLLDGLETLQQPPNAPEPGQITDPALAALVRELAMENPGLCVITTREPVTDLAGTHRATTAQLDLAHLSPEAGAMLLRELGVQGADSELRQLVQEVRGHALTLSLTGRYLVMAYAGDIRKRGELKLLKADAAVQGGHAFHIMETYDRWFLREGEQGRPLIAILHLLGLFDGPADSGCLAALRRKPPIADLTEPLMGLTDAQWRLAISQLASCGLVSVQSDESAIDSHALVREYYAEQVRTRFPAAWREGQNRCYEHFQQIAPERPDTLEEMMPLFAAVTHGCQADQHQRAFDDVYYRRICRESELYQLRRLGVFGADLGAISGFFLRPWDEPVPTLRDSSQAWLLNAASFDLRALGRPAEAMQPARTKLDAHAAKEDWEQVARAAGHLSESSLTLGALTEAAQYARQSMNLADRSENMLCQITSRTALADVLHQAGQLEEAEKLFHEAEIMQTKTQPEYPLLCSLQGYRYCDLLLTLGGCGPLLSDSVSRSQKAPVESPTRSAFTPGSACEPQSAIQACHAVQQRATQTIRIAEQGQWPLDIALDHLSLGRAILLEHVLGPDDQPLDPASKHLNAAVDGLRRAGRQDCLPLGLLARAALWRVGGDPVGAARDLGEAKGLADRSGMKLFLIDGLIEQACQLIQEPGSRTQKSTGERLESALECVARARTLIESTGYHRRDREIRYLEQSIERQS